MGELYQQHTDDTGQVFEPAAIQRSFYWTQGQPFLVNVLARKSVMELVTDRNLPITAAHIDEAKELLIRSRTTHLVSLSERLKEPRVAALGAAGDGGARLQPGEGRRDRAGGAARRRVVHDPL